MDMDYEGAAEIERAWREGFLRDGLDADTLLATGDAMARRVVDYAQAHARQQRIQREQD